MSVDRIPDPAAYAERIGVEWPMEPTRSNLDRIVLSHQLSIPYENILCHDLGEVPDLDLTSLFRKVVSQRRGGYCFELNRLFEGLLDEIGYATYPVSCRVRYGGLPDRPMLHRATVVVIDGAHLFCDVAFSGPEAPGAVPVGDAMTSGGETFTIKKGRGPMWEMSRESKGRETLLLEFWDMPVDEQYFIPANFYCSRCEESRFVRERLMNIRRPDGSATLVNNTIKVHRGGTVTTATYDDPEKLAGAILDVFGVEVDPAVLRFDRGPMSRARAHSLYQRPIGQSCL